MNDETRASGPGGRLHGPGEAPEDRTPEGTMEAQEDALETTLDTSLMPAADPERLRFGVAPSPQSESAIAPSPMERPVGPAAARHSAMEDPQGPDPDVLHRVEAATDPEMMPPTIGSSGVPSYREENRPEDLPPSSRVVLRPASGAQTREAGEPMEKADPRGAEASDSMIEASRLIGFPVVTLAEGREVGHIRDVIFSPENERLSGFTVARPGLFAGKSLLAWKDIHAVGRDVITVADAASLAAERKDDPLEAAIESGHTVIGKRMLTENGNAIGTVEDLVVDRRGGEVLGFRMRGGKDPARREWYLPVTDTIAVGEDAVTVPAYLDEYARPDSSTLHETRASAGARRTQQSRIEHGD